ncbi:MAG: hypothetical protein RIC30_09510 [Marinoscillum sp.]|uniref:hypothetical protein n=1 Tax=Marinoscillum sp. TaxID=2024838 RepID=UPI0032FF699C
MATKSPKGAGVNEILNWKFDLAEGIPQAWRDHLGEFPQKQWYMYVDGEAGHGKTDYIMQLTKMLATHIGKVSLNGVEQGKHTQIRESAVRHRFDELEPGKFIYEKKLRDWDLYKAKMKNSRPRVMIIDSISMWPLTVKEVQELLQEFEAKIIILVAYAAHFNQNKPIRHLCDIKVRVENFQAITSSSRFGGSKPFTIWEEGYRKATGKKSNGQMRLL